MLTFGIIVLRFRVIFARLVIFVIFFGPRPSLLCLKQLSFLFLLLADLLFPLFLLYLWGSLPLPACLQKLSFLLLLTSSVILLDLLFSSVFESCFVKLEIS